MRKYILVTPIFIIFVLLLSGAKPTTEVKKPEVVEIHGKIVCLAEEMHTQYKVELTGEHDHLYGVKAKDDIYYTILRTPLSEALFVDQRLHKKNLIINGRVFPDSHLLEVSRIRSIHEDVIYELYYFCDTCYIRTVAPGNCDCCQAPVVLIEKPMDTDSIIPSP